MLGANVLQSLSFIWLRSPSHIFKSQHILNKWLKSSTTSEEKIRICITLKYILDNIEKLINELNDNNYNISEQLAINTD
jgi:hypothetical protein